MGPRVTPPRAPEPIPLQTEGKGALPVLARKPLSKEPLLWSLAGCALH